MYWLAAKLVAVLILLVTCYIFYLNWQNAKKDVQVVQQKYEQVLNVNAENAKTVELKAKRDQAEREATAKAMADARELEKQGVEIKKANRNDPEANTVAGPAWDAFSERLRNRSISH